MSVRSRAPLARADPPRPGGDPRRGGRGLRAAAAEELSPRSTGDGAGDTIYAVDRVGEERLVELFEREIAPLAAPSCWSPRACPAAGVVLPRGRRRGRRASGACIVDPIDGTRGLMYQKRSAWVLTGVAPNRGPRHEPARHRARRADRDPAGEAAPLATALGGARRGRCRRERFDRLDGHERSRSRLRPSRRPHHRPRLRHGVALLSRARATSWPPSTRRSCGRPRPGAARARPTASRTSTSRTRRPALRADGRPRPLRGRPAAAGRADPRSPRPAPSASAATPTISATELIARERESS